MALNTSRHNHLTALHFKGLITTVFDGIGVCWHDGGWLVDSDVTLFDCLNHNSLSTWVISVELIAISTHRACWCRVCAVCEVTSLSTTAPAPILIPSEESARLIYVNS